jgi:hypothetical protein
MTFLIWFTFAAGIGTGIAGVLILRDAKEAVGYGRLRDEVVFLRSETLRLRAYMAQQVGKEKTSGT